MPTTLETNLNTELLEKYSVEVPRYTSYPTAPEWTDEFSKNDFLSACKQANKNKTPVSLYFHLPFCEKRCHFCACNVVASKKKQIVSPYITHVKKEISNIAKLIEGTRTVEQIHLGGGTPTYLSPAELNDFYKTIKQNFEVTSNCEISIEIDPRVTTFNHLTTLQKLGFNRISMGIQDFDPKVQEAVNRIQPFEETSQICSYARALGFKSVNIDLIYGLPYQTKNNFKKTLNLILEISPDRIALFHYAHLPKLNPHQAKYITQASLPSSKEKLEIFQHAVRTLTDNGYIYIGLDHFAKPEDELAQARQNKTLHRNFQGYTTKARCDLYSFGITAISSIQNTYSQNIKKLNPYYEKLDLNEIPLFRGIVLNPDDILRKEIILKILCQGEIIKDEIEDKYKIKFDDYFYVENEKLSYFKTDGLIKLTGDTIKITNTGQFFLRNIASVFDSYLRKKDGRERIFSKSI